jgi:NAD(P)H-hydrate epimerase
MLRLTRHQLREIDRRAIDQYHIPGVVLMENASRAVADAACQMLDGQCVGEILIHVGAGNNGGDGLAAARNLHSRGADITLYLTSDPSNFKNEALINWQIVQAMHLPILRDDLSALQKEQPLLIIDSVFGTGLTEPPRDPWPALVTTVEHLRVPILAVDIPSGLDCDTGICLGPCLRAHRTVTFVAEKVGFAKDWSREYLGQVTLADIGCPRELIEDVAKSSP